MRAGFLGLNTMGLSLRPNCCNPCCGHVWPIDCLTLPQFLYTKAILVGPQVGGSGVFEEGEYVYVYTTTNCKMFFLSPSCKFFIMVYFDGPWPGVFGSIGHISLTYNQFVEFTPEFFCEGAVVQNGLVGGSGGFGGIWDMQLIDRTRGDDCEIPPDPQVPPDPPNCDGLTLCEDIPNLDGSFREFVDFDAPPTEFGLSGVMHWLMSNLNISFSLPYTDGGSYIFEDTYVDALYNYSDPGHYFGFLDADIGPEYDREFYLTALRIRVMCDEGQATIDWVEFRYQQFSDPTGDKNPLGEATFIVVDPDSSAPGHVGNCVSAFPAARFKFQNFALWLDMGDESHHFDVLTAIGAVT